MSEKKKNKNNSAFYIALCCCVGIIGFVGYFTNREQAQVINQTQAEHPIFYNESEPEVLEENNDVKEVSLPTLSPVAEEKEDEISDENIKVSTVIEENNEDEKIDINNENVDVLEKGEPEDFYDGETVESVSVIPDPNFLLPCDGEICEKYSGDNLIYNEALDDWRTHNGIDIKADSGSDVLVSADGVIEDIYTDYLGNTVIIGHNNGFKTKYSSLDSIENLSVGTEVSQGDFLAKISNNSFGENVEEPHLHFEVIKNDEFVNPEDYIK